MAGNFWDKEANAGGTQRGQSRSARRCRQLCASRTAALLCGGILLACVALTWFALPKVTVAAPAPSAASLSARGAGRGATLPRDVAPAANAVAQRIAEYRRARIQGGSGFNTSLVSAWDRLAEFTDSFGARPGGSRGTCELCGIAQLLRAESSAVLLTGNPGAAPVALEDAIDWMVTQAKADGFEVTTEPVAIPYWTRGHESATLVTPTLTHRMAVTGLGFSKPTPPGGIEADVVVVSTFNELEELGKAGKVLALSVEDARMVARIYKRKKTTSLQIRLIMENTQGHTRSRNVVISMPGVEEPETMAVMGGHIDSWDLGVGAVDDGAGFMVTYQAMYLLKVALRLPLKRTLRVVLFTAEETGIFGGDAYFERHRNDSVVLALESDFGVFTPRGLTLGGKGLDDATLQRFQEIGHALKKIGLRGWRVDYGPAGADVAKFCEQTICGSWVSDTPDDVYFRYHHAPSDMMEALDPQDMEETALTLAAHAAVLLGMADLKQ